eukprot:3869250-Rhodomonas_salina.2
MSAFFFVLATKMPADRPPVLYYTRNVTSCNENLQSWFHRLHRTFASGIGLGIPGPKSVKREAICHVTAGPVQCHWSNFSKRKLETGSARARPGIVGYESVPPQETTAIQTPMLVGRGDLARPPQRAGMGEPHMESGCVSVRADLH